MKEPILEVVKWADAFFVAKSPIHETMRRLAQTLGEMKLPFAVAGAMAANALGRKRTTADVAACFPPSSKSNHAHRSIRLPVYRSPLPYLRADNQRTIRAA